MKSRKFASRTYWENYIDTIIGSINNDKDTIIDMLMYGNNESAKITMNISLEIAPSYTFEINKVAEKSPFGDEEYDE